MYEQQEQRQCLKWEVPVTGNFDDYPWAMDEEYMDENRALYYDDHDDDWNDMDDMLEASMLHEAEDDDETRMVGNDVVAPGFWRPNKLY